MFPSPSIQTNSCSIKKYFILLSILLISGQLPAQNPIVPPGMYTADPSAHVWNDGRLYVYGSRDESPGHYCSHRYDVLSTADLINWEITKDVFASDSTDDQVPYSNSLLFAPDCSYNNGKYFLYYCQPGPNAEGVATSTSPTGPFTDGRKIHLKGIEEIDPCLFIDDDGQGYYIWGQFTAKMARLKSNMKEIDTTTITDNIVTEKEHFFHEGGYLVKRKGIYYFIYAHMGRSGEPTCIGYSTSKSPMGPYKYGGVIIDNDDCDPGNWNNHGSIVEFNGQWYVFYHRATHGSHTMRKACVEPIYFNDDGSIDEVEMTTQGAAGSLNPLDTMDAARACLLHGNVRIEAAKEGNEILTGINDKDNAAYKYFKFSPGIDSITLRVAPGENAGKIHLNLNTLWGPSIGVIDVPGNGDGNTWTTVSAKINEVEQGVHAVWLRFRGEGDELVKVDWFQFSSTSGSDQPAENVKIQP